MWDVEIRYLLCKSVWGKRIIRNSKDHCEEMRALVMLIPMMVLLLSCSHKTVSQNTGEANAGFTCVQNEAGDFEVCLKKSNSEKLATNSTFISYYIARIGGEELTKGTISNGRVTWLDNDAVEVYQIPGNISTDLDENDMIKVYLISERKFITKKEYLESL